MNRTRRPLTHAEEERLARYRAGTMTPEARGAFEREILADDALSEALYSELALDAVGPPRRRPATFWLPIAAAVLALSAVALLWPRPAHRAPAGAPATEILRGDPGAMAAPLEPIGTLDRMPATFRWARDRGAEAYRLEIYGPDGEMVLGAMIRDTTITWQALGLDSLASGTWRVVPLAATGAERAARAPVSFEVR
jgi:hypothetical protein